MLVISAGQRGRRRVGFTSTPAIGLFDSYAELPRRNVDVTLSMPTGPVYTVKASGGTYTASQFQTALNTAAAQESAIIVIDDGLVCSTGAGFDLPARSGAGWVYVMSASAYSGALTAGRRVSPADASRMAVLRCTNINVNTVRSIEGANASKRYRLVGLQIENSAASTGTMVGFTGSATDGLSSSHLILDRCYIPGRTVTRRGVSLDCAYGAVIHSYINGMRDIGNSDSQAVWTLRSEGPTLIDNNYLEAASENFLSGGSASSRTPTDITFTRNHVYKPESWIGVYPVKNLFELKFGKRILLEGNIFENCWTSGQTGGAVLFKSTSQTGVGDGAQYVTEDVTIRYNKITGVHYYFSLVGATEDSTQQTDRLSVHDNLCVKPRLTESLPGYSSFYKGGSARHFFLDFKNNTCEYRGGYWQMRFDAASISYTGPKCETVNFSRNIMAAQVGYPVVPGGAKTAGTGMAEWWTNVNYQYNAWWGGADGSVDATNQRINSAWDETAFVNAAAGDYALVNGHPFKGIVGGSDPGVDMVVLNTKIAGTLTGTWS